MSQRESLTKPFTVSSVEGVNERLTATQLPQGDFSQHEGLYPQSIGLQARAYGKRLLAKYDFPIMGIAQFWTPLGYANGLYQFEGSVDAGAWLTPTGNIVIPTLPPSLGFDGGGMSLDDFGNSYGGPLTPANVCTVGFVGLNSVHTYCNGAISNVGTPDDSNGGPGGQGKICRWQNDNIVDYSLPSIVDIEYGEWSDVVTEASDPTPYPIYPNKTPQEPTTYSPGGGPYGSILFALVSVFSYKVNLGFGNWRETQGAQTANTRAVLNFSAILDPDDLPSSIEFKVRHNGNMPFDYYYVPIEGLSFGPEGNYTAYPVNAYDFVIPGFANGPNPLGGGFTYSDFIVIEGVRTTRRQRVCS